MGHEGTRYSAGKDNRPGALALCTASVLAATAWWAWRRSERVEVSGLSMAPELQPGDRLVIWRPVTWRPVIWRSSAVHTGDVVAAADPRDPQRTILKRAGAVGTDGVLLLGDNPSQSTDSRHFGRVPLASVRGKAVYRYAPPGRAGRLRRT
jgi:nickel-type superoxide dismutase maturation protease